MGGGMARAARRHGFRVDVWNRTRARSQPLWSRRRRDRAARLGSRAQAPTSSSAWSPTTPRRARSGWARTARSTGAAPGAIADRVEHACRRRGSRRLRRAAAATGCVFLDAPVTGSKTQAAPANCFSSSAATAGVAGARAARAARRWAARRSTSADRQRRAHEAHQQLHLRRAGGGAGRRGRAHRARRASTAPGALIAARTARRAVRW